MGCRSRTWLSVVTTYTRAINMAKPKGQELATTPLTQKSQLKNHCLEETSMFIQTLLKPLG